MRRTIYLIAIGAMTLCLSAEVKAQTTYSQDLNGSPIKVSRYLDIKGSPFLFDSWMPSLVQLENGQTYQLEVKYDLVADELLFKDKNGDSLNFVLPVKEFKFTAPIGRIYRFKSGYPATTPNTGKNTLYEVLYDGNPSLLKKTTKSIWEETTTYGTATRTKNISSKTVYYLYDGSIQKPLKNQKKAVIRAFSSKSAEIEKYINDNNLDMTKDEDLIKVFTYANTGN